MLMREEKQKMKKEKGAPPSASLSDSTLNINDEDFWNKPSDFTIPSIRFSSRNASSKYDFVKVKVWLGDNADHYYVLSRFLLSRMLTVTKIPNHVAIKIALDLKKLLIDNSLLDVSQSDLEANLFKLMERRGYGEEYINRYKMMTRFHHQRVPLVILVCGTACVGKSTIATQIAQRLNLPNVLQTDMVYELLRSSTDAPLGSTPVWARDFPSSEELITEFCRECRIVRKVSASFKGLAGDLKKAMKDGKPIIIEGMHIDPSIYLMDDENKARATSTEVRKENLFMPLENTKAVQDVDSSAIHPVNVSSENQISDHANQAVDLLESMNIKENCSDEKGKSHKDPDNRDHPVRKEKPGAEPIIIPIVLRMSEFDHTALLEEWISSRTFCDKNLLQEKDNLISNFKIIQDYLCSFSSQGLTVVNISASTFPQTLDWLHNYLLQCIEQGISSVPRGTAGASAENRS